MFASSSSSSSKMMRTTSSPRKSNSGLLSSSSNNNHNTSDGFISQLLAEVEDDLDNDYHPPTTTSQAATAASSSTAAGDTSSSNNETTTVGMAKFGSSFANMAEAMLEEEYRNSHISLDSTGDLSLSVAAAGAAAGDAVDPSSSTISLMKRMNSDYDDRSNSSRSGNDSGNNINDNKEASGGDGTGSSRRNDTKNEVEDGNPQDHNTVVVRPSPTRNGSVRIQLPRKRQKRMGSQFGDGTKTAATAAASAAAAAGNYSTEDIVLQLQRAMSTEERQEAIDNAIATLDHDDRNGHDQEIHAGVDIALVKMLVFLEFKSGFRRHPIVADMDAISREIGSVLTALECVYRASTEAVGMSFGRVGTDLLHMLVIYVDDELQNRMKAMADIAAATESEKDGVTMPPHNRDSIAMDEDEDEDDQKPRALSPAFSAGQSYERDMMLRKAAKILGHFARVGKATKPICHFPGLIGSILNLINFRPFTVVPFEARLSCLWTIANLACNTDNMRMMMCTPNLIASLVGIGCRQPEPTDSLETIMEVLRAKSIASRALLNLSWSPENKILMSENMGLVQTLSQMALERRPIYSKSKTMQDIMIQTRRHSIGALRNIAASPRRCKVALCSYSNGKLLDVLTDVALNETDPTAMDLAFATIHNLAVHDTAQAMVDRPALVLALKNVLLEDSGSSGGGGGGSSGSGDGNDGTDSGNTVKPLNSRQNYASSTILVLERSITPDMPSYENLHELLEFVNPSKATLASDAQQSQ